MFDKIRNWVMERVWSLHGMNCKEAIRLASRTLDRPLGMWDQLQLRFHFVLCKYCHYYYKQQLSIRKWLRCHADSSLPEATGKDFRHPKAHLSDEARKRILRTQSQNNPADGDDRGKPSPGQ